MESPMLWRHEFLQSAIKFIWNDLKFPKIFYHVMSHVKKRKQINDEVSSQVMFRDLSSVQNDGFGFMINVSWK